MSDETQAVPGAISGASPPNTTGIGFAAREKYWHEKTDAEKIDTLAQELARVSVNTELLQTKLELLEKHEHRAGDGKLMVPMREKEEHRRFNVSGARDYIWQRLGLRKHVE